MKENMGSLCQKVDDIKESITGDNGVLEKLDKQNGRVRKLEIWRGFITGGLVMVSLVVGFFARDYIGTRDNMIKIQYLEKEITQLEEDLENGKFILDVVER